MKVFIQFKRYVAILLIMIGIVGATFLVASGFQLDFLEFDNAFGQSGTVRTDFYDGLGNDEGGAIALQKDDKIVMAGSSVIAMAPGYSQEFEESIALARYNSDGSLDEDFGDRGLVLTSFDGKVPRVTDLAVDYSGRIVVGGYLGHKNNDFLLVRYTPEGQLDSTFGTGGVVFTDFQGRNDRAYRLDFDHRGRIILAGESISSNKRSWDVALARYNSDGSMDPTFGILGMLCIDLFGEEDAAYDVIVDHAGKILITGYTGLKKIRCDIVLARFTDTGGLDETFGNYGRVKSDAFRLEFGSKIKLLPKGRLLVSGTASHAARFQRSDLCLVRYNLDGTLDHSFGDGGWVKGNFGGNETGIALFGQTGGRILVAMRSASYPATENRDYHPEEFVLARYNWDGSLDDTFGHEGVSKTDFFERNDQITDAAMRLGGKIVVGGFVQKSGYNESDFALARYLLQSQ